MIENWIELALGALLLISPWLFGFGDVSLAKWMNVGSGLILVLMGAWALYGREPDSRDERESAEGKEVPRRQRIKKVEKITV